MVEGKALFEWSPEVAIAMGTRFCSWVVAEEDEDADPTEDAMSMIDNSRFDAQMRRLSYMSASEIMQGNMQKENGNRPSNNQGDNELPMFGSPGSGAPENSSPKFGTTPFSAADQSNNQLDD